MRTTTTPFRWPRQPKLKVAIVLDGRTITEVAAASGLSLQTVSGVCNGRLRPTDNIIGRVSKALGRDPSELFDLHDNAEQVPA